MAEDYNIEKIKSILKYASNTGKKLEQSESKKKELEKHFKKIQTMATRKGVKKETIQKTLEELQNKINQILVSEGKVFAVQEKDEKLIKDIKDDLQGVDEKFYHNYERIGELNDSMVELREKMNQVIEIKKQRDERMKELEEKIKSGVDKNFQEMLKIEQQISDLEERYVALSRLEKQDHKTLRNIRFKIEELRKILEMKKLEHSQKSKIPLPDVKIKHPPSPKLSRKPEIKHDIHITPLPELKEDKPMPSKKRLFPKMFKKKKKPEPIWDEEILLKEDEGIKIKPDKELELKTKQLPESSPFGAFPPEIDQTPPMPEPEPTFPKKDDLPPIPEPPHPPGSKPPKKGFWSKIKRLFKK